MRFYRGCTCNYPCNWKEGAVRQISFDAIVPLFIVPLLTVIASQNLICTIIIFIVTPPLIYYIYFNFLRFLERTKFFFTWTIASVLMLMIVFEQSVVPLLEILPEENLVFIVCVVSGLVCGYKTRKNADRAMQESTLLQELEHHGQASGEFCNLCHKQMPKKTFHCKLCQTCISRREYHCKWLDCCIGMSNLRWYMTCLFFSAIAFIYGSNLTMTSVCHPVILVGRVLIPDDCSDVYHQLDIAICFVSSVYSLLIGFIILFYLFYHLWLVCIGKTSSEKRLYNSENQSNEGILKNTTHLFFCKA